MLQKQIIIEFTVANLQCDDCKKTYTPHKWKAQVQVRQKVEHKRTFLFLEQLIIKHNMQEKCNFIQNADGGINFQYLNKAEASKMVNFIQNNISCRTKHSNQLVSHDEQNATANEKMTFSVELAPICRDDMVLLPKSLAKELGGIGPLVLVYKISKFIHIVDIHTMQTFEVDMVTYWKTPFKALFGRERLTEFVVLDIEGIDTAMNDSRAAIKQKFK